jgi:hypothetical protein
MIMGILDNFKEKNQKQDRFIKEAFSLKKGYFLNLISKEIISYINLRLSLLMKKNRNFEINNSHHFAIPRNTYLFSNYSQTAKDICELREAFLYCVEKKVNTIEIEYLSPFFSDEWLFVGNSSITNNFLKTEYKYHYFSHINGEFVKDLIETINSHLSQNNEDYTLDLSVIFAFIENKKPDEFGGIKLFPSHPFSSNLLDSKIMKLAYPDIARYDNKKNKESYFYLTREEYSNETSFETIYEKYKKYFLNEFLKGLDNRASFGELESWAKVINVHDISSEMIYRSSHKLYGFDLVVMPSFKIKFKEKNQ